MPVQRRRKVPGVRADEATIDVQELLQRQYGHIAVTEIFRLGQGQQQSAAVLPLQEVYEKLEPSCLCFVNLMRVIVSNGKATGWKDFLGNLGREVQANGHVFSTL